jgi:hypothetical protein
MPKYDENTEAKILTAAKAIVQRLGIVWDRLDKRSQDAYVGCARCAYPILAQWEWLTDSEKQWANDRYGTAAETVAWFVINRNAALKPKPTKRDKAIDAAARYLGDDAAGVPLDGVVDAILPSISEE